MKDKLDASCSARGRAPAAGGHGLIRIECRNRRIEGADPFALHAPIFFGALDKH